MPAPPAEPPAIHAPATERPCSEVAASTAPSRGDAGSFLVGVGLGAGNSGAGAAIFSGFDVWTIPEFGMGGEVFYGGSTSGSTGHSMLAARARLSARLPVEKGSLRLAFAGGFGLGWESTASSTPECTEEEIRLDRCPDPPVGSGLYGDGDGSSVRSEGTRPSFAGELAWVYRGTWDAGLALRTDVTAPVFLVTLNVLVGLHF
jgi:hypothetical protein